MKMSEFLKSKGCFEEFVTYYIDKYPSLEGLYRVPFTLAYVGDTNKTIEEIFEGGDFWSDTAIEFMKIENPIYDMYEIVVSEFVKRDKTAKKEYELRELNDIISNSFFVSKI